MTNNESKGPFEGLLVIDMTHVLNGPFGTQLLCNMGARVIKVEPPGHGDDTRTFGPYVDYRRKNNNNCLNATAKQVQVVSKQVLV